MVNLGEKIIDFLSASGAYGHGWGAFAEIYGSINIQIADTIEDVILNDLTLI